MLCARCKVAIAYAPFDGNLPSYLVAVYRVGEASAVRVFVSPRKSCSSTMVAGVVAVALSVRRWRSAAPVRSPNSSGPCVFVAAAAGGLQLRRRVRAKRPVALKNVFAATIAKAD